MEYSGLLAGLGNPGNQYEGTRHNCGFIFVEKLLSMAQKSGSVDDLGGKKMFSRLWRVEYPDLKGIWLAAEPQTFMNDSGKAIQAIMNWYKLTACQLVVVQDELDIPAGSIRFKYGGGFAGHNGLKSIGQYLGTADFYRLRIGIGKPEHKGDVINWVLSRPAREETVKIMDIMPAALETFFIFSREGGKAATQFAHAAHVTEN